MKYKLRTCEARIKSAARYFKVILVIGARQMGKSSLLAHLFPTVPILVFDPLRDIHQAKENPDLFLANFPSPLILDEIQFAPQLLPSIKRKVDQSDAKGQYFMTGSQQLSMLKSVTESLAGRVGIFELHPMTPREMYENHTEGGPQESWLARYLSDPDNFQQQFVGTITTTPQIFEALWRGGMPGTIGIPLQRLPDYFTSYIQTYVERDVRTLENIEELDLFGRFFTLLAALTAQEINYAQLGREIGLTPALAKRWLKLLKYSYQWHEIWPYHGNSIKRISQKSKGFFSDTGIACHMHYISSPQALAGHPMQGALFETYCFNILRGLASGLSMAPQFYHWRTTSGGAEVDFILEIDGALYPIEAKCKMHLTKHDTRGMQAFRATYPDKKIMPGLIIYAGEHCYWVDENTIALPWNSI